MFSAVAFDPTLFDWETSPSSPLLPTRTGVFVLLAPDWKAAESAPADCSLLASWPIAWVPPDVQPHFVLGRAALILIRVLLRRVQVAGGRRRVDAVRLGDVHRRRRG